MAHQVESMFSVKQTPWHGLGKIIQNAPTIAEGIKLAGLDWQIVMQKAFLSDGREAPAQVVVRKTDQSILGVVGPQWKPLQNAEAFEWFNPFLETGAASLTTAGSLQDGKRVWVMAELNMQPAEIVPGDEVRKFLLLSNSHDGTLAVRVGMTPIRVVCANTLAMAHSDGRSQLMRIRHTKGMAATLKDVREIVNTANASFEATADQYRHLAKRPINKADLKKYVKSVFEMPNDETKWSTRTTNILNTIVSRHDESAKLGRELLAAHEQRHDLIAKQSVSLLEGILANMDAGKGQSLNGGGTFWNAYNAVTEYLSYDRGFNQESRLNAIWFGEGAKVNERALNTAMQMTA